jgi:glycosyltransferase involved in cell wall biosynthesis
MRILLVNSHGADPGYGGAERYVRDLAGGLERRGHDVTVLSAFPARGDAGVTSRVLHRTDWRDARLRRVRNHVGDLVSAPWQRLDAVLGEERPDVLHTSNLPGIGSGVWECARRREIPVVHTLHDYHLLCPRTSLTRRDGSPCRPSPRLCGLRTRRLSRWAGAVGHLIAGSDHLLRVMNGLFPAADPHVVRLPLAPVPGAGEAPPASVPRTIGYIGALTATKGVELLLEARGSLAEAGLGLRLAGDGPLREAVAASGVDYAGRVDGTAKGEFLASCDIGVVPSLWNEPSGPPYVVCEWLAAGRPVLVTRRPALLEAASRHGGIVPFEESTAGLSGAMSRVSQEWARLVASLPAVKGDADVDRWLQDHERIFELALDGGRSAT